MYSKIIEKIEELNRKSDYNHLKYDFHKTVREIEFSELKKPIVFLDDMKAKKYWQKKHEINKKNLLKKKNKTVANINMFFNKRNCAINFVKDQDSMILEAKKGSQSQRTQNVNS